MNMNVCQTCETPLTPEEWLTGTCPFCGETIKDRLQRPGKVSALFHGEAVTAEAADRTGWATTRAGLGLYVLGVALVWTATAANASCRLIQRALETPSAFIATLQWASGPAVMWGLFTLLAGYLMCLTVPRVSRARVWIWMSVGFSVLSFGLLMTHFYMTLSNGEAAKSRAAFNEFVNSDILFAEESSVESPSDLDDPWSDELVDAVGVMFLIVSVVAYACHIVFLSMLARYLMRKSLSLVILLLFGAQLVLYVIAALFVVFVPEAALNFGGTASLTSTASELVAIFFLLSFVLMTGYIGCFVVMRGCIAQIVRGEYLRESDKIPAVTARTTT